MGWWSYKNIGASARPENIQFVRKIFEYIGYAPKPATTAGDYDECIFRFREPEVYGCETSEYAEQSGNVKACFGDFDELDLLNLLNALFPNTSVFVHATEGNTVSDTWEFHDKVYNTGSMTLQCKDSYTDYGGGGPNGYRFWKERFALNTPMLKHVKALINLCAKDGNEELLELFQGLISKLKNGQIAYEDDTDDSREIGAEYDVKQNEWNSAWEMQEGMGGEPYLRLEIDEYQHAEAMKHREEERRKRTEERQRKQEEARRQKEEEKRQREDAHRQRAEEKARIADEARQRKEAERRARAEEKQRAVEEKQRIQAEQAHAKAEKDRLASEAKAQKEQARLEAIENAVILYAPGEEPANIRKRLDTLFAKLDVAYPNHKISRLNQDHKKWGETVTELYRLLGYVDSQAFLEAYGYTVEKNAGGRPTTVDPAAIVDELHHRYQNGSAESMDTLKHDNPDIPWKTLANNAKEYFGSTLAKFLKSEGILK